MLTTTDLMAFVPVTDLARAQRFYATTLGLRVRSADDYGCRLECNGATVRLARVDDYERPPHTVLGWGVQSIEETVRSLLGAGVDMQLHAGMGQDELGVWTAPSGDQVAWYSDSEGNTLSVTQPA